jgi:hypothetical protein
MTQVDQHRKPSNSVIFSVASGGSAHQFTAATLQAIISGRSGVGRP